MYSEVQKWIWMKFPFATEMNFVNLGKTWNHWNRL